ncbi:hypothetical protein F5H01DRAFT_325381 [Linnemannia elongata]|nr:hypothetical protein F5H01DRAFT_325381 [Linnemannia elongata]
MPSSPPQGNFPPSPPSSASCGDLEIAFERQQSLSQLEHTASLRRVSSKSGDALTNAQGLAAIQLELANFLSSLGHRTTRNDVTEDNHGPGGASDAMSVSSSRSSKVGLRKRLSRLFKRDSKVKETALTSAASPAPVTLVGAEGRIQSAAPDRSAVSVSLGMHSLEDLIKTSFAMLDVPVTQVRSSPAADVSIRMNIFPENVAKPIYKTDLPKQLARVDKTPQLAYCCNLLLKAPGQLRPDPASEFSQDSPLDN